MDKKILIVGGIGIALIGYFLYRKKNLPITQSNTPTSIGDDEEIFHPILPNDDSKSQGHKQMTELAISKRRKSCSMQKGEWVTTSYGGECINKPPPKSTLNEQDNTAHIGSLPSPQNNPQHTRGTSQNDPNKAYHAGPSGLSNSGNEYVVP
jgi:hypothetical protein